MKYIAIALGVILIVYVVLQIFSREVEQTPTQDTSASLSTDDTTAMEDNLNTPYDSEYTIVPTESTVTWTAEKPLIVGYTHHGTFAVAGGNLSIVDGSMQGAIMLDMTALKVTSLGGGKEGNESRLETHLKSEDFFDVDNHPTADFAVRNSVKGVDGAMQVVGDLTIKGITHEVVFPAVLTKEGSTLTIEGQVEIDRTLWDIQFGSASFFDNLADSAISDTVKISLRVVAEE